MFAEKLLNGVGFWIGARRPRGGHGGSCMYDQWKWMDSYGRTHGTIAGFTAFIPGKPDKLVVSATNSTSMNYRNLFSRFMLAWQV